LSAFDLAIVLVGILAGAVAAIAGFGVGSLLTPLLASHYDPKLAVALVALPHAIATALRLWRFRHDIAWPVLRGFGAASASGGLIGAFLFTQASSLLLARLLGALLLFVGVSQLAGVANRLRLRGSAALVAGALSGLCGGMVGNQGGIRSAGLLAFDLTPRAFIATGAVIALIVDLVRLPVYLWTAAAELRLAWLTLLFATAGIVVGTFGGTHVLLRIPPRVFRRTIGALLLVLGLWLLK
jgi:uncharacterized protein